MITIDAPPEPRIPDAGATLPRAPQTEHTRVRRPIKPLLRMAAIVAVVVVALFLLHERVIATLWAVMTVETHGVWNLGWTLPNTFGSRPSRDIE